METEEVIWDLRDRVRGTFGTFMITFQTSD